MQSFIVWGFFVTFEYPFESEVLHYLVISADPPYLSCKTALNIKETIIQAIAAVKKLRNLSECVKE